MWDKLCAWDNLCAAYHFAALGKRGKSDVAAFEQKLGDQLIALQDDLQTRRYQPGSYRHFYIYEPKRRRISAAPFRDRVLHHALCNVIEPIFEPLFINDSYANRANKGTHAAIDRLQYFAQHYRYVLRADIVQHFPSLDHDILRQMLAKTLRDPKQPASYTNDTGWLIDTILNSNVGTLSPEYTPILFANDNAMAHQRPRGLPIGNLTSQFWSNVYLNDFDWFVQRDLGCPAYLRYVDDFALFSNNKAELWDYKCAIIKQLAKLRLVIHQHKADVIPCEQGIPWLGFVVYPSHRMLKRRNVVKFVRKLQHNLDLYFDAQISFAELDASINGWVNHVRYADTWGLRNHIFNSHPIPALPKPKT